MRGRLLVDNYDDQATWQLIQEGRTKGCFQIESALCKAWCKKILPNDINDLSAVISLVRPGCLESVMDGKNMPSHYAARKNGIDPIEYKYECLKPALKSTYGVLTYQEQIMQIVRDIAGFTLQEADVLRKAAGKKLPEEMAKVRKMFIEGCEKTGIVNNEQANEIFDWIEKSQRYLFVKAHGVAYAIVGYETAYYKAHYPIQFFTAWLRHAHDKIDPLQEKAELVSDAKMFNIDVCVPDIRHLQETFYIRDDKIYFGLGNIKAVGESQIKKIIKALEGTDLALIEWFEFLRLYSDKINKTAMINLISVGAFDYTGLSRNKMIYEYDLWNKLTQKEKDFVKERECGSLAHALEVLAKPKSEGGGCSNKNRVAEVQDLIKVLENPMYSVEDTPTWIAQKEKDLLGISITFHSVDDCDAETANCTCKDYLNGYNNGSINIAMELNRVAEYVTTKGKNPGQTMAFITGSDSTGQLDSITCFPAEYATFKELLVEGNTVLISGTRSKQNSLLVKAVIQI